MTRRLIRKQHSNSMLALFYRTLAGVPTPWCTTSWVEDGEPKVVRFRLWVRRRGHTLHVETHADSPAYPGLVSAVKLQRQGMYQLHSAGMRLVRLAKLDPTAVPAQPRSLWDKSHEDFLEGKQLLSTVASHLYHFLNPKRGRPRIPPIVGDATTPGAPVGMRMQRRKELMLVMDKVINALEPMLDRANDARKMKGYDVDQRHEICARLDHLYRDARVLKSIVFNDKFTEAVSAISKLPTEEILGITPEANPNYRIDTPAPLAHATESDTLIAELTNL